MLYFEHCGYGYSKKFCESIVLWFIGKYLPRHKLSIIISHKGLKRERIFGIAEIEGSCYRPREFLIDIQSNMKKDLYLETLVHELWHVYQWVKGDLKENRSKRLWKGVDYTDTSYENQPWEKEAYQMESILFNEYLTEVYNYC